MAIGGGSPDCYWLNSTLAEDHFCFTARTYTSATDYLNGTFGHHESTPTLFGVVRKLHPCSGFDCPIGGTNVSWESPDHTGEVVWTWEGSVFIGAIDR